MVKHLVFPWHSLAEHQRWHFLYYGKSGGSVNWNSSYQEQIWMYHWFQGHWIFSLTHQKTWWQKMSILCSAHGLFFISEDSSLKSVNRFVKGTSIQGGRFSYYWAILVFYLCCIFKACIQTSISSTHIENGCEMYRCRWLIPHISALIGCRFIPQFRNDCRVNTSMSSSLEVHNRHLFTQYKPTDPVAHIYSCVSKHLTVGMFAALFHLQCFIAGC